MSTTIVALAAMLGGAVGGGITAHLTAARAASHAVRVYLDSIEES